MGCLCATRTRASSEDLRALEKVTSISYQSTPSTPGHSPRPIADLEIDIAADQVVDIVYDNYDSSPNSTNALEPATFRNSVNHRFHDQHKVNLYSKQDAKPFASGAFASIFLCEFLGSQMAIKKVLVATDEEETAYHRFSGKSALKDVENELKILRNLQQDGGHQNVVQLVDDFYETTPYDDVYLYLVMEFIPSTLGREITKHSHDGDAIPNSMIKRYSFQILKALQFLKRHEVIHRDLKPENILLNPTTNELKICDFGCSVILDPESTEQNMASYVCSRNYRAPELILGSKRYDYAVDLWSFGCILGEMYLGHTLFDGDSSNHQMNVIMEVLGVPTENDLKAMKSTMEYEVMIEKYECADRVEMDETRNWRYALMPCEIEEEAIELLDTVLRYDPSDRKTAEEALSMDWFQGMKSMNEEHLNHED